MKLGFTELPYHHQTVEYVVISEQPYGGWEYSTGNIPNREQADTRLAQKREKHPDQEHRLAIRVTTTVLEVLPEHPE